MDHIPCVICEKCVSPDERLDVEVNEQTKPVCYACYELIIRKAIQCVQHS